LFRYLNVNTVRKGGDDDDGVDDNNKRLFQPNAILAEEVRVADTAVFPASAAGTVRAAD
jgi:hypothetical protein